MARFILFQRGAAEPSAPSTPSTPEEMQLAIEKFRAWLESLSRQGKLRGVEKLKDDGGGRILSVRNGQIVVDGPFAETKETIGGYYIVEAADYDEAIAIASASPIFDEGGSIELREIEEM